jgi:tripartite-type tricarboxylate transporter receptor subunit TctC
MSRVDDQDLHRAHPLQGSAPAVTDLIAGQVDVMFDNTPNVLPHVRAGKLKAIAVSSKTRSALAPGSHGG